MIFLLSIDPLDPLTEQGEVLSEFHHGNNCHAPSHHTRGPEERMEQHIGAVEFGQDDTLLVSFWVRIAGEVLVSPEVLHDDTHQGHRLFKVVSTLRNIGALLIDFHGLLGMVEEELLPGGSQVHVHLQARVLRELPAVWPTAEGTVKCLCDRHVQQGALSFFCPHTLHVRAQQCDPQQEVHHDGAHHHGQP